LQRSHTGRKLSLSIIVNFYNMQREAERTLRSLSRSYQKDAEDFAYEVICIDNGSNPPLDPQWIGSFGPEFRLFHPSRKMGSPCAAINEAALQARGDYLAIMIDGAHMLTPGVFSEARRAWQEHPDAIVALRHWFIGGDQRWFAVAGYTQQMEDKLFERIHWPTDGYELFRIGAPISEGPEPWLEGMSESNCLMLPTALYDRIGGMDEAFQPAGGGFANLDLWQRASDAATGPLVALIGEASFHQFHGGTTTNVEDSEKDTRVRAYAYEYRKLRGKDFAGVPASRLQLRGSLPSELAKGVRQRAPIPAQLPITAQIRPGRLPFQFDDGAQSYLHSIYAESSLKHSVTWLGQAVGAAPSDLISIQEIIHQLNPDAIVMVSTELGLVHFVQTVLDAVGNKKSRILHVSESHAGTPSPPSVKVLHGQADAPHTLSAVRQWTAAAETVLVLYAANLANVFSAESLRAYGSLVSYRSYLICLGTVFGQPWLGYSNRRPLQAIRDFIRANPSFTVDQSRTQQLVSTCPSGYLQRIGNSMTAVDYDPTLDDIVDVLMEKVQ
jgi:cephalosporin hydroxylase